MATPLDPEAEALRFLAVVLRRLETELVGEVALSLGEGLRKLRDVVCASIREADSRYVAQTREVRQLMQESKSNWTIGQAQSYI